MSNPILGHYIPGGQLILYTDASDFAMGWILHQLQDNVEKVLVYGSKTFNETQTKYCCTDKECLAVVTAIIKLRHFLAGEKFIVRTDHHALCWLMKVKDVSGRLARYALRLQEFDFSIEYKSGKMHANCDALSRFPAETKVEQDVEEIPVLFTDFEESNCSQNSSNCILSCNKNDLFQLREEFVELPDLHLRWQLEYYRNVSDILDTNLYIESDIELPSTDFHVLNNDQLDMKKLQNEDPWIESIRTRLKNQDKNLTGIYI